MTTRPQNRFQSLPERLYSTTQARQIDSLAIQEAGIAGFELMQRAGSMAFSILGAQWPDARRILVLCGYGNNGGDGYIVAQLAKKAGREVQLMTLVPETPLKSDAQQARQLWETSGGRVEAVDCHAFKTAEVIVDAIFGIGLERPIEGDWYTVIQALHNVDCPILALDIPSGLHGDTGNVLGIAIKAAATVTFVAVKRGLLTGDGMNYCGRLFFSDLAIPLEIQSKVPSLIQRLDSQQQQSKLITRLRNSHKGHYGHACLVGGSPGFGGAIQLAGEAALRTGAGLVSIATHPGHAAYLNSRQPELMVHGIDVDEEATWLWDRATVIAIGPGLGQSRWSAKLFESALASHKPLIVDADALNLLSQKEPHKQPMRDSWILTPHPGEAARLLHITSQEIQADRFRAVQALAKRYHAVVVLKGSGTLIAAPGQDVPLWVCPEGNPGMASGGMGDLLTGMIAALVAQGHSLVESVCLGVSFHALAGDLAASQHGERGLLASDLLPQLGHIINPIR